MHNSRDRDVLEALPDEELSRLQNQVASERQRTIGWLRTEMVRRQTLLSPDLCRTYVISFPRSGNHAVRYAVERLSRQPTLGAHDHESFNPPRGVHDLPLFLRDAEIVISNPTPICVKRHSLRSIDNPKKIIYLERDPIEAVLSHAKGSDKDLSSHAKRWYSIKLAFQRHPASDRLLIGFDELLGSEWLTRLADFLAIEVSRHDIAEVSATLHRAQEVLRRRPQTLEGMPWVQRYPREAETVREAISNLDDANPERE
jgi:hypothetical protein